MPGAGNLSSGYTSQIQSKAIHCDQARLLARLQGYNDCCPRPIQSPSWPPASSTLERKSQSGCGIPTDILAFPKKAILPSVYTLSLQTTANLYSERFSQYARVFPTPCPQPTITNAGMPKPSKGCSYTSDQNLNTINT